MGIRIENQQQHQPSSYRHLLTSQPSKGPFLYHLPLLYISYTQHITQAIQPFLSSTRLLTPLYYSKYYIVEVRNFTTAPMSLFHPIAHCIHFRRFLSRLGLSAFYVHPSVRQSLGRSSHTTAAMCMLGTHLLVVLTLLLLYKTTTTNTNTTTLGFCYEAKK